MTTEIVFNEEAFLRECINPKTGTTNDMWREYLTNLAGLCGGERFIVASAAERKAAYLLTLKTHGKES